MPKYQFSNDGVASFRPLFVYIGSFVDSVLRGISQVMFQNNLLTGILFLVGIFYNSMLFGVAVLVGTIVSTATAKILKINSSQIRHGLFGFNGALVAVALSYFLEPDALTWLYLVIASAGSTILMAAMLRLFEKLQLPVLTAPFVFSSLTFLLAYARFGRLHSTQILPMAGLPTGAVVEGTVSMMTIVEGLFLGVAQVFFQGNVVTGVLFVIGLFISSKRSGLMALFGSIIGILVAWGLGAAEPAIRSGAFGFNPVLTAIALGAVFFNLSTAVVVYAAFGAIITVVVFAAISAALGPLGMPALTLPFVLVTWIFILASSLFPNIQKETS